MIFIRLLTIISLLIFSSPLMGSSAQRVIIANKSEKNHRPSRLEWDVTLKDPLLKQNWGLKEISTFKSWKKTIGDRDITVAVIDTGADISHPDLKNNLWLNSGETGRDDNGNDKAFNGIDDDGNGYIDDVHGYDFVRDQGLLNDDHGHGTHISGIIGAEGGNGRGISGVAPRVRIMVLKYFGKFSSGQKTQRASNQAFRYAIEMGADIINYSGGGRFPNAEEESLMKLAEEKSVLIVAAAGNHGENGVFYPASYPYSNIISVASLATSGDLASTSNFGKNFVDLLAPGEKIYSLLPDNSYGYMTGTSQATAFVSGIAALYLSLNGRETRPEQVKHHLMQTGRFQPTLIGKSDQPVVVNALRALTMRAKGQKLESPSVRRELANTLRKVKVEGL